MEYSEFETSFVKENRKLKIALAITLTVAIVGIILQFFERRYFLYKGGPIFEERPLAEEICRLGFVGLAGGTPNPHVVHEEVIKLAEKENFLIPIEKIFQVKSLEEGTCKIVLKTEGAITAFKVTMDGSHTNPFYYRLIQLDEVPAKEEL